MARSGRAGVVERALEAGFSGEVDALAELFTEDVSGWSPNMLVASRDELAEVVAERETSISNMSLEIDVVDIVGNKGYATRRSLLTPSGSSPRGWAPRPPRFRRITWRWSRTLTRL